MKKIEEQVVTYEVAVELNKLGFNESCIAVFCCSDKPQYVFEIWNENIKLVTNTEYANVSDDINYSWVTAPLYQDVIDWFREKYDMHININPVCDSNDKNTSSFINNGKYSGTIDDVEKNKEMNNTDTICLIPNSDSYYKASEESILTAIQLIKNKL